VRRVRLDQRSQSSFAAMMFDNFDGASRGDADKTLGTTPASADFSCGAVSSVPCP
jgi:hypothetical protein